MAEEVTIFWDITNAGQGYENAKKGEKYLTEGEILAPFETVNKQYLSVGKCLVTRVKAASIEEGMKVAREAFGSDGGVAMGAKTSNVETKAF